MKSRLLLALAAAALAIPPAAVPAQGSAAAQRDWSRTVVATAEGGYRMGNPGAPVRLVEYGSISCSHCAEFSEQAAQALRSRHVRPGRVSYEYRPYMIFPTDPGAFMLLGCLGPARFFAASEQLYASQAQWSGRLNALPAARLEQIAALPELEQVAAFVKAAGLDLFFRRQGMSAARIDSCLADRSAYERLIALNAAAEQAGVQGTPTFEINGQMAHTNIWAGIEPLLQPPGR